MVDSTGAIATMFDSTDSTGAMSSGVGVFLLKLYIFVFGSCNREARSLGFSSDGTQRT